MQLIVKTRKVKIQPSGQDPIIVNDTVDENEKLFLSYNVSQLVEALAKLTQKAVTVQVTEEAVFEPKPKEEE